MKEKWMLPFFVTSLFLLITGPQPNPSFLTVWIKVINGHGRSGGVLYTNNSEPQVSPSLLLPPLPG